MNPEFQNREVELKQLLGEPTERAVWYVYGEAGIGKSALLAQLRVRLRAETPPDGSGNAALIVDMAELGHIEPKKRPAVLLETIRRQVGQSVDGRQPANDASVAEIAAQLVERSYQTPVYLLFDTTEAVQQDMAFWEWLEDSLISPLAIDGTLHQIFAGRVPVPWRRYEIRRIAKPLRLESLTQQKVVHRLIEETILTTMPNLHDSPLLPDVTEVISDLASGHPELTIKLASDVADCWPTNSRQVQTALRHNLCRSTVKPFITGNLFEGIDDRWQMILWWASVLKWFDLTILTAYLEEVMPDLREDDYFFLQGINRLRLQHTVVWREGVGDQLHGVIPDIVAKCMQTLEPEDFRKANTAAAKVLQQILEEVPADGQQAEQFKTAIAIHRQRARVGEQI